MIFPDSGPFRPSIGTKLLLVILPCLLAGTVLMFIAFERLTLEGRLGELRTRLESFAVTQGASLVKPVWEFDRDTVDRLFRSYASVPELLRAELIGERGEIIAATTGADIGGHFLEFRRDIPLSKAAEGGDYVVGRLTVWFHDGVVQADMTRQRRQALGVLAVAFFITCVVTLWAVSRLVARPLRRLRDSLQRNTVGDGHDPVALPTSKDELGQVTEAYNQLLREIDQRSRTIHHLAYHDSLTQLPNRRLLEDRLGHAIAVANRQGGAIAVLFADVDNFKVVNDTLGHKWGDELLKVVGERLTRHSRGMDTIARWGGDEFVVVVENLSSPTQASSIAEKIIEELGAPVDLGNNLLRVGISIGISLFPQDGQDVTTLIKNADMALFEAKGRGRNAFHFFDQTMNAKALRRLEIEVALRQAIVQGQLELHYQPKVGVVDHALTGLEALIRWRRPGEGLVAPDNFIPIAEESDLIIAIGDWVLKEACTQILRWQAQGLETVPVAVNLSPRHFRSEDHVNRIIETVASLGVPPSLIEIELTESTIMHDPERAVEFLGRLRRYGFGIAIDDFGTGYSNLSYLRRLPITTLKIDRSFVRDIEHDEDDAEIIRTIIAMGNVLGLGLVAEGVETEGQLNFLSRCDCAVVQGFYFARPMPASDIEPHLGRLAGEAPKPLRQRLIPVPVAVGG